MALPRSQCEQNELSGSCRSLVDMSTDELACLAKCGDSEAFAVAANLLRPRLLVVLTKRLNGQFADAEDVVQDTLTRAWQSIASYDEDRSFAAWVYTIALRRATDYLRSNQRRKQHVMKLSAKREMSTPTREATDVEDAADNIWAIAKQVLSSPQYEALWLRYAEQLPVNEIATTIGKSAVATRVLLHRARCRVQKQFSCESSIHE